MSSATEQALQIPDGVRRVSGAEIDGVVGELLAARRIACYAGGRERKAHGIHHDGG